MRYSFSTQRLFTAYDEARQKNGAVTDSGWTDFDELQVPYGYVPNWRELLEEPAQVVQPTAPTNFDVFRQYGKKGGEKTKERGTEYYREIGRLGGRGNRR